MSLQGPTASELQLLGYDNETSFASNDLTININPMLEYEYQGRKLWNVESLMYERLKPALRLATALVESPTSMQLHYDILCAGRTRIPTRGQGTKWYEPANTNEPDSIVRPDIHRMSCLMAENINFVVVDHIPDGYEGDGYEGDGLEGATSAEYMSPYKGHDISDKDCKDWNGCLITIQIQKKVLEKLFRLRDEFPSNDIRVLYATLQLAILLNHELTHGVNFFSTTYRRKSNEPFYQQERCAELGFAWEQQVLGGILDTPNFDPSSSPAHVHTWPSFGLWEDHSDTAGDLPPPNAIKWFLSLLHVGKLHQQAFWDGLSDDRRACHYPKLIGQVAKCDEFVRFVVLNDKGRVYFGDVEGEYTLSKQVGKGSTTEGRIVRARSLDPEGSLAQRWTYDK